MELVVVELLEVTRGWTLSSYTEKYLGVKGNYHEGEERA